MRIIPFIPLLAAIAPLAAVELGPPGTGLMLNGYGEAFAEIERRSANHPRNGTPAPREAETAIDFPADMELRLNYAVDRFSFRADFLIANRPLFDDDDTLLEQAFVDWHATEVLTVRAGRSRTTWLGWEGFRTPEMLRVNHSAAWDWNVENHGLGPRRPFVTDGVGVLLANTDRSLTAELHVADDVLGEGPGSSASDKAVGGCVAWNLPEFARMEIGAAYDPDSVNNGDGTASDAYALDVNIDVTALLDHGWFMAAECQVHRHPGLTVAGQRFGNDLVALGMVNYAFAPGKASITAMVDYVERGFAADDNELWEYAVALLTTPHKQVRLNLEVFVWDETADGADSYGGSAVILVALP
jgi:hypothetical protein